MRRFTQLWDVNATRELPVVVEVGGAARRRSCPSRLPETVVHGDYRLGNLMLERDRPDRVAGGPRLGDGRDRRSAGRPRLPARDVRRARRRAEPARRHAGDRARGIPGEGGARRALRRRGAGARSGRSAGSRRSRSGRRRSSARRSTGASCAASSAPRTRAPRRSRRSCRSWPRPRRPRSSGRDRAPTAAPARSARASPRRTGTSATRGRELVWTAEPNRLFAAEVVDLAPGRALDVACGEGRNAVWLAERGWRVTAVDFAAVGLAKARELAAARGVEVELGARRRARVRARAARVRPRRGRSTCSSRATSSTEALRTAADAVAPGGTLLVLGHDTTNLTDGHGGPKDVSVLFTPEDVVASLGGLVVERAEKVAPHCRARGRRGDRRRRVRPRGAPRHLSGHRRATTSR